MMKNILLELIKGKIETWDKTDIYAVSLYVYDMNDNPCEPVVILGYNTVEQFQKEIPNASGEQEAKWNYAFWLQNEELSFGTGETQSVVRQWIEREGYSYFTYEEIPVLIHELEYYEEIAEQNLKANPAETVEEFVKFCYEG